MSSFAIDVSYAQIAVFDGRLQSPFNNWREEHFRQGFVWRPGSCSFRTLIESGLMTVDVVKCERVMLADECVRTISVPFHCEMGAAVEVATITESQPIELAPGAYQLVFETGWSGEDCWCRLLFVANGDLEPKVLVADSELTPGDHLLMDGEPA